MQRLVRDKAATATALVVIASFGFLVSCGGNDDMPTEPDPNGIKGFITDAKSARPIAGANITTTPSTESATTNANGFYEVTDIVARDYTVTATKPGYLTDSRSVVVELNGIKEVNIPLAAKQNDPVLSVDPTYLDFQEDDDLRQIAIRNAGTGEISFSVVATGYDWIDFAEGVGGFQNQITGSVTNNTRTITVRVDRDGLLGDVHTPEITVDGGSAGRVIVDCRIVKRRTDGPLLDVFPSRLDLGDQVTKDLDIINYGVGTLRWDISEDLPWLFFDRYSDSTIDRTTIRATVDRSGLDPDTYSGQIEITSEDDAGERFVDVEMTVKYVQQEGTIIVDPEPDTIDAPWQLTGPDNYSLSDFGDKTLTGRIPGAYTMSWGTLEGYDRPSPDTEALTLAPASRVTFSASYVQQAGTIVVDPEPDAIDAPWELTGPDNYDLSNFGDKTLTGLVPGAYTLSWGSVKGYDSPSPSFETSSVAMGGTVTFRGSYSVIPEIVNIDFGSGTFADVPPSNGTDRYEQDGFIVELENTSLGINDGTCPGRWCVQNPYTAPQEVTLLTRSDGGSFDLTSVQVTANSQGATFSGDGGAYLKYDGVGTATFGDAFKGVTIVRIGVPCSGQYNSCFVTIDNIKVNDYPLGTVSREAMHQHLSPPSSRSSEK